MLHWPSLKNKHRPHQLRFIIGGGGGQNKNRGEMRRRYVVSDRHYLHLVINGGGGNSCINIPIIVIIIVMITVVAALPFWIQATRLAVNLPTDRPLISSRRLVHLVRSQAAGAHNDDDCYHTATSAQTRGW